VRLQNPDLVVFHTLDLARLGVMALFGTRQRMLAHTYDSRPIQRGTVRRLLYSRVSRWYAPDARAKLALRATGLPPERISVLRPFFDSLTVRPKVESRNLLQIPDNRKTFAVVEPSTNDVALLYPILREMVTYDVGYTLVLANPDDDVAAAVRDLSLHSDGQAVVLETDRRTTERDVMARAVGASDAVLELTWDNRISVPAASVYAMKATREVISVDTTDSRDVLGDNGVYLPGTASTQIRTALRDYTYDQDRAARLRVSADANFGLQRISDLRQSYANNLPIRSRERDGLPST
jgi:hypothetical protein